MSFNRFRILVVVLSAYPLQLSEAQDTAGSSACTLEGPNNCQLYDGSQNRTPSDNFFFNAAADDFVPQGSTIESLCVWGQYVDIGFDAPDTDCSSTVSADSFLVQVYESDGAMPGALLGQSAATSTRSPVLANRETEGPATTFIFELTLDAPIVGIINDGRSYWLAVGNNSESTIFSCVWHWSKLSPAASNGNHYAVRSGRTYAADQAFCLDMDLGVVAPIAKPCCRCDGTCEMLTLADCNLADGTWFVGNGSCSELTCAVGPPPNDVCTSLQPIVDFDAQVNTTCATTDGFNPVDTELGPTDITNDIWFSYVHDGEFECGLSFSSHNNFDSVIAVYFNPDNPTVCPCPNTETEALTLIGASDEFWPGVVGGGGFVGVPVPPGECGSAPGCYTIRIGGFDGDDGFGHVDVNCAVPEGFGQPSPPVADPSFSKTRFISMTILDGSQDPCFGPGGGPVAVRVTLTSLHHVNPPYNIGPSTPFTAFEGQVRWVGPPRQYLESSGIQAPFYASMLQCTPHYRDWSTVGLLHVTGSAIVPSSIYDVQTVSSSCAGHESTCVNVSTPVTLKTTRWADVAEAYNPPDPTTQPNVADFASMLNKFRDGLVLPWKARVLIAAPNAFGEINTPTLTNDFNFSHIAACVDAFRGNPYPYKMGMCAGAPTPPATGACTTDAECIGTNGSPPCKLFAMGKCTGAPNGDCTTDAQCFAGGANGAPPCIRFFGCP